MPDFTSPGRHRLAFPARGRDSGDVEEQEATPGQLSGVPRQRALEHRRKFAEVEIPKSGSDSSRLSFETWTTDAAE